MLRPLTRLDGECQRIANEPAVQALVLHGARGLKRLPAAIFPDRFEGTTMGL
ncbi:hypothetical protein [Sphingomonas sp. PR090111-T3T-6A]|uniref:hypothetical protein n=1 Tax=Sphingomonas sp. PR090111-T3T-6A TaxID=685778 RepID=UPI00037BAA15|nr:hypothetical protein [Sphingomonas sp. PR090111-T3T-6A]